MEEKVDIFVDYDDIVLLCKKCYENNEYYIPLYKRNKETNIIEYKCCKSHIIKEEDILKVKFNEDLKICLNNCECKEHKNNVFCGWCEDCKKNICFFCLAEELKKNINIFYS